MKRIRFQFCFVMLISFATFLGVAFGEGANRQHNLFNSFAAQDALQKDFAEQNVLSGNISAPEVSRIAEKAAAVSINADLFKASEKLLPGDTVLMNLFNGEQAVLEIQAVEVDVNHVTAIRGPVQGSALDFFYISIDGDKLLLTLDKITTGRKFQVIFNRQTGKHSLYDIPLERFEMPNGGLSLSVPSSLASGKKMSEEIAAAVSASDPNEEVTVDVMIVYTQEARAWADANGGINSVINQAMATAQQVLDNSTTSLKIKLVHSSFVGYNETKKCANDLPNLTGTSDGQIDEVHVLRQAYGADLVSMFVSSGLEDYPACGYGLQLEDMPNGIPDRAFSVVGIKYASAPDYNFIHELGHNMGAGHHKDQNDVPGPQLYPYSAAWRWVGSDTKKYCSVMSYRYDSIIGGLLGQYSRAPYFSNPSISHLGAAAGDAVYGDNARTIRETKHLTATYSSEWTNSQAANLVLGQSNFSTDSGGAGAGNMYHPNDVAVDWATGKIFVADAWNNRVLRFASGVALMTGASAEAVLGQSDFNTTSSGTTARNMSYPTGVFSDPAGHLWVADKYNNRVLRFDNAATKASGAAADGVLGQADFTSGGYATDRNRMYCPSKVAVAAGRLWVSDHNNHRVLRFENAATKENGADADGVLGQADFTSGGYATTRNGMYYPNGIAVSMQGTLFISENMNHRVLRFENAATKENGADADGVLGQADFTSKISATTQNGMSVPVGVSCDNAGRLYVAEYGNSRVLMFDNAASKPNGANADSVLGQPDFTTRTANDQGISSRTLNSPGGVFADYAHGALCWVADNWNHRVLRYGGAADVQKDSDGDGIDDGWEASCFGDQFTANATSDFDKDGYSDKQEYLNWFAGQQDPTGGDYNPKGKNTPGGMGYAASSMPVALPAIYKLLLKR